MKAIGLTDFGGPEVLRVLDLPAPQTGPDEIRIRVVAAAVNPIDSLIRRGLAVAPDSQPPHVPGMELSGFVDEIGQDVATDLRIGDRVSAIVVPSGTRGAYAEYVTVPADSVVPAPVGVTDVEAATLAANGLTAQIALDLLGASPGQTVAVTAAAGAAGGYVVQLAKANGLRVIADAAPEDETLVKELGADVVLPRGPEYAHQVRRHEPDGVAGLVDTANLGEAAAAAVQDGGTVISLRGGDGVHERGVITKSMVVFDHARERGKLDRLCHLAQEGRLTLRVAQVLPAEQAVQAHRLLEAGGMRGRVVLTF